MISYRATKWPCEREIEMLGVCFDEAGSPGAGIGPKRRHGRGDLLAVSTEYQDILHFRLQQLFLSQRHQTSMRLRQED